MEFTTISPIYPPAPPQPQDFITPGYSEAYPSTTTSVRYNSPGLHPPDSYKKTVRHLGQFEQKKGRYYSNMPRLEQGWQEDLLSAFSVPSLWNILFELSHLALSDLKVRVQTEQTVAPPPPYRIKRTEKKNSTRKIRSVADFDLPETGITVFGIEDHADGTLSGGKMENANLENFWTSYVA